MAREHPQLQIDSLRQWREWLEANHGDSDAVWLVTFKRAAGDRHVPYAEAVEEALAFGWIDSQSRALDAERTQLHFTPRRPGSGWARTNKERVARLTAEGRMAPAGMRAVEAAKADGSWAFLDDVEALVEPADLREALDAQPGARGHWDAFPPSGRRAILLWIRTAKRPATREQRIREAAARAARNERANEPRSRRR